ncbi:MAG: TlpA family protein disulfide reductase, partial [Proteobacteria bacterium]
GKVVLVDFWATWCKPCAKSFPKYQELYVKYKDKLEIVAVSEDEEKDGIDAFGKTHGVKFPLAWDEGKSVAGKYDPKAMPTAFLIDKAGVIRFAHFGYEDGDEKQVERELKELF